MTRLMITTGNAALALALLAGSGQANAAPSAVAWLQRAAGMRLLGASTQTLFSEEARALVARDARTGARLWQRSLRQPSLGSQALAVAAERVYLVDGKEITAMASRDGRPLGARLLPAPRALLAAAGSLYVVCRGEVVRLSAETLAVQGRLKLAGPFRLLGAEGPDFAVLSSAPSRKGSSARSYLDFYRFGKGRRFRLRLLRDGRAQVLSMRDGVAVLLDGRGEAVGTKPRALFLTTIDYRQGKKTRDLALGRYWGAGAARRFAAVAMGGDEVAVLTRSPAGTGTELLVIAAGAKRVRWMRSVPGAVLGAPVVAGGRLWLLRQAKAGLALVAHRLGDGAVALQYPVPGSGQAAALYALAPLSAVSTPAQPARLVVVADEVMRLVAPNAEAATGGERATRGQSRPWKRYRDRRAGYSVRFPRSWRMVKSAIKDYSARSFSVPFVRYHRVQGSWQVAASVHVLVRPAQGDDAEALWRAVLAQQRARYGSSVQQVSVERVRLGRTEGVIGTYRMKNGQGIFETARSLCLTGRGLAFELRGGLSTDPAASDSELRRIFLSFRLRPRRGGRAPR